MRINWKRTLAPVTGLSLALVSQATMAQRAVVPGSGSEIVGVADDFEDPEWSYVPRNPKSTEDIDEKQRSPMGRSTNGRWYDH